MLALVPALLAGLALQAEPAAPRDYAQPPDGLAADQQLWRDVRDASNDAVTALGRIAQCSFRIDYGGYYQRLDVAAGNPETRAEATRIHDALTAAATAADAKSLPPPRDPAIRECREVLVNLDTMMPLHADRKVAKRLAGVRKEARRCVKVVRPFADVATARATALEAALAEVDRFVPGPPPGAATAPAVAPAAGASSSAAAPGPSGASASPPPAPTPSATGDAAARPAPAARP